MVKRWKGSFDCLFDIIEEGVMTTWCISFFLGILQIIPNHPPADALYKD
jgi:hypothetical protein